LRVDVEAQPDGAEAHRRALGDAVCTGSKRQSGRRRRLLPQSRNPWISLHLCSNLSMPLIQKARSGHGVHSHVHAKAWAARCLGVG
jgi:hypothetical protein